MARCPAIFVSHGSPELALRETPAHLALKMLGLEIEKPRAVLVVSAHWETGTPEVATGTAPETIYDFGGFDPKLRTIRYPAPGAPEVSRRAQSLLAAAGIEAKENPDRGYDHGVWAPLTLVVPEADVAVAQLSIQPAADPRHHHDIGRALRPLRDEGVMMITSGALTHNLGEFFGRAVDAPAPVWVTEFNEWVAARLIAGDREALLDYRSRAPHAVRNHPSDEHLLPLFVALGARFDGEPVERLHQSYEHGVIAMDLYRFG